MPEKSMNVKDARRQFAKLINSVQRGRSIAVTRRGKTVAQITPPATSGPLPDLSAFRQSIQLRGESLSDTVTSRRNQERY